VAETRFDNRIWINSGDRGFAIGIRIVRSLASDSTPAQEPANLSNETPPKLRSGQVLLLGGFKYNKESGSSFRTEQVVAWNSLNGDILVERQGEPIFFMPGVEGGVAPDTLGNIVLAGIVEVSGPSLTDIKTCPDNGYQHGPFKTHVGGLYCVHVRDGSSYAKITVKEIQDEGIRFEWVYNPTGTAKF
jgi:hypothetical protein